ncbi:hypothetical protein [Longimicrobium terrae]|uniref:Uncharacterized protein n=1 Tax=Longimicrobium terrae TaxID=1639882 RepID=A0A841H0A7_9BACT|nr:hypothetical protein [Longimicrobium terrae]MBB4637008.1 hypothetical protein [Longimicrobium terrae]MBB6071384.1 hypothetical protein [Longimicrobium terrae]NNC31399.1 hypothetical protein [Longimicrobium terrae]
MDEPEIKTLDLRHATDEELIAFVFDHPVDPQGSEWYWSEAWAGTDVVTDPAHVVAFLTRLFRAPEPLLDRFSTAQIDRGIWMMFGAYGNEHFRDPLWDPSIPWAERAACIAALPAFYERLLIPSVRRTEERLEGWFMLPDFLAFPYEGESYSREDEDQRRVQDALFAAFLRMLYSGDASAGHAALHGIFHLRHPDGPEVVRGWLDAHPAVPAEVRAYAENALARGEVL